MISEELHIAPLTVRTHIRNLMAKLGVHTRLEAVAFALKNGVIDSPS
jgi:DNA-binding NarL/FixJ family response regulator